MSRAGKRGIDDGGVLLHLDLEDEGRLREALGNIHNLREADAVVESNVRVVANGAVVRQFRKEQTGKTADRFEYSRTGEAIEEFGSPLIAPSGP